MKKRVEEISFCSLSAGFIIEVTFGHPDVRRAKNTLTGARIGFGEDGDGGDARLSAGRFYLEKAKKYTRRVLFRNFPPQVCGGPLIPGHPPRVSTLLQVKPVFEKGKDFAFAKK